MKYSESQQLTPNICTSSLSATDIILFIFILTAQPLRCTGREFRCNDGLRCIPRSQRCDQIRQCADSSDEQGCQIRPTPPPQPGKCCLLLCLY